jgi:hypothetical protein
MRFAVFALALAFAATAAHAADPPKKKKEAAKGDPDAYAKSLASDANVCGAICMDELNIMLFSGMITVPFERPSVEQCGIWMSSTPAERAQELTARRKEADDEAAKNRYSPKERDELRKRKTEPVKSCEAEFKRRCDEAKTSLGLEARKKALAVARAEIDRLEDSRKATVEKYLANVLSACTLDQ